MSRPDNTGHHLRVPPGYVGPAHVPGTGRQVYWTGRVAIGLRHQAPPMQHASASQEWLQDLLRKEPA
jgi:hypothetical protein